MIDAHCHLDDPAFDADRAAVLMRAHEAGVSAFVIPGVRPSQYLEAPTLRRGISCVIGVGVHPMFCGEVTVSEASLRAHVEETQAEFIGEFGFDRRVAVATSVQRQVAELHLAAAQSLQLPVVLHVVRHHGLALNVLRGFAPLRGMVHGFTGPAELVPQYEALGLHLSVGGAVTRPNARRARAAVQAISANRLLLETDAPDQTPDGAKPTRNEPCLLPRVAETVAELRCETVDEVAAQSATNAERLFFESP